jgi:hypothetical protein
MLTLVKKYEKNAYLSIESFHFISEIFEQNDLVFNQ